MQTSPRTDIASVNSDEPTRLAPLAEPGDFSRAWTVRELAARLQVSVQTIYDLRSQGRGPRGFRIGRELRFRQAEVDAWLARMEELDGARHPAGGRR